MEKIFQKPYWFMHQIQTNSFCSNLPFGILSFSSYVDIESMYIISFDEKMSEYKLLGTKSKKIVNAIKLFKKSLFV